MNKDKSSPSQQAAADKIIVDEMLRDSSSGQWYEWSLYVSKLVHSRAQNIPYNQRDDIVQEAMMRIHKNLPNFQFKCALRTWIYNIVYSCIIDTYRKSIHAGQSIPLNNPHDDAEVEGEMFIIQVSLTLEDECILRDELRLVLVALQEFLSLHANSERNRAILDMVLFENRSLEETAQTVGCNAPVVGYVVRSARRYVREKLGY